MKRTEHILLMMALAGLTAGSAHAAMHHDHHHHAAVAPCEIATEPCQCHPCESPSCAEERGYRLNRIPDAPTLEVPSGPLPECCRVHPAQKAHPPACEYSHTFAVRHLDTIILRV